MTKKELMIKAHKMTKEIKAQYPAVDYKFQLGLCLSYLLSEGENEMMELKGTERQIKWAEKIRENVVKGIEAAINDYETMRIEKNKNGEKCFKRFIRYEETLRKLLEDIKNNNNSKFFIENYSDLSTATENYSKEYFMIYSNNVEF